MMCVVFVLFHSKKTIKQMYRKIMIGDFSILMEEDVKYKPGKYH